MAGLNAPTLATFVGLSALAALPAQAQESRADVLAISTPTPITREFIPNAASTNVIVPEKVERYTIDRFIAGGDVNVAALTEAIKGETDPYKISAWQRQLEKLAYQAMKNGANGDEATKAVEIARASKYIEVASLAGSKAGGASAPTTLLAMALQQPVSFEASTESDAPVDTNPKAAWERLKYVELDVVLGQALFDVFREHHADRFVGAGKTPAELIELGIQRAVAVYPGPLSKAQYESDLRLTQGKKWVFQDFISLQNGRFVGGDAVVDETVRVFGTGEDTHTESEYPANRVDQQLTTYDTGHVHPDDPTNAYHQKFSTGRRLVVAPHPDFRFAFSTGNGVANVHNTFFNNPGAARLSDAWLRSHGLYTKEVVLSALNARLAPAGLKASDLYPVNGELPDFSKIDSDTTGIDPTNLDPSTPGYMLVVGEYVRPNIEETSRTNFTSDGGGGTGSGSSSSSSSSSGNGGGGTGGGCFVEGTLVTMADGSKKDIKDVRVGDEVLDAEGRRNTVRALIRLHLGDQKLYGFNPQRFVTRGHPFQRADGSWASLNPATTEAEFAAAGQTLSATRLYTGDEVKTCATDGRPAGAAKIHNIFSASAPAATMIYNLDVSGSHTYCVTPPKSHPDAPALSVHNK